MSLLKKKFLLENLFPDKKKFSWKIYFPEKLILLQQIQKKIP